MHILIIVYNVFVVESFIVSVLGRRSTKYPTKSTRFTRVQFNYKFNQITNVPFDTQICNVQTNILFLLYMYISSWQKKLLYISISFIKKKPVLVNFVLTIFKHESLKI